MDSIRVSEAPDPSSILGEATATLVILTGVFLFFICLLFFGELTTDELG